MSPLLYMCTLKKFLITTFMYNNYQQSAVVYGTIMYVCMYVCIAVGQGKAVQLYY